MTESKNRSGAVTISQSDQPSTEEVAAVTQILNNNNLRYGYQWASVPLSVVLKDAQGKLVGGLIGSTNWGWLHVDL